MWFLLSLIACADLAAPQDPNLAPSLPVEPEVPECVVEQMLELPEGIEPVSVQAGPHLGTALVLTSDAAAWLIVDDHIAGSVAPGLCRVASWTPDGRAVVVASGSAIRAMSGDALLPQGEHDLTPWLGKGAWSIVALAHAPDGELVVAANPLGDGGGRVLRLRATDDGFELVASWPKGASGALGAVSVDAERVAVVVGDADGDRVQLLDRGLTPLRVVRPAKPSRIGARLGLVGRGVVVGLADGTVLMDLPGSRDLQRLALGASVVAMQVVDDRVFAVSSEGPEGATGLHVHAWTAQGTKLKPLDSWGPVTGLSASRDRVVTAQESPQSLFAERRGDVVRSCASRGHLLAGPAQLTGGTTRAIVQPVDDEAGPTTKRWWVGF